MKRPRGICVWGVVVALALSPCIASARGHRTRAKRRPAAPKVLQIPEVPPEEPYESALLLDADSGVALFEKESFKAWPQASLVKMMVALVALEAVAGGEISLTAPVRVSRAAALAGGSQVHLRRGEVLTLEEALDATIVASANDASIVVAEAIAGSREAMIDRMNLRAAELGMADTHYYTVNGLPPARSTDPTDVTTAHDLAILARTLLSRTGMLDYSSKQVAPFRNGRTRLRSTNLLLGRVAGVDGLKTGYIRVAGFNFVATATRSGMRLIAIVLGCPTLRSRFDLAQVLLEWGFAKYSRLDLVHAGEPLAVQVAVANGSTAAVRPIAAEDSSFLVKRGQERNLEVRYQLPTVVTAPISKDQALGEIIVRDGEEVLAVIPAIAPEDVAALPPIVQRSNLPYSSAPARVSY
jgi:D-alanyl-D-alanine carboxypeptidase (penicillin-binding protein 5/6)